MRRSPDGRRDTSSPAVLRLIDRIEVRMAKIMPALDKMGKAAGQCVKRAPRGRPSNLQRYCDDQAAGVTGASAGAAGAAAAAASSAAAFIDRRTRHFSSASNTLTLTIWPSLT